MHFFLKKVIDKILDNKKNIISDKECSDLTLTMQNFLNGIIELPIISLEITR